MRIAILGDSHLARVRRDLPSIAGPDDEVVNVAEGGAFASDLVTQLAHAGMADVLVVSIGSNDAFPWKQVAPRRMATAIDAFLGLVAGSALVYVLPPGVDESRLSGPGDRTDAVVSHYTDVAAKRFRAAGATLVDTRDVLTPLGRAAFTDDGVHLTGAAYGVLLPAIREAVMQTAGRPAT